ncbi:phosphoenolpyruvate carboxylase [Porphyrobacter algicida]|uniref:Phosphoenolpyruvate carboxylase n=1 Tax=Qipengyuania algicida TaxID=1836209 RepID=A0A845AGX3_9SPHN|nr:phosphoenolpyruvate carboxylase [Qipengyuania algicida]MXP29480.1 phosphoenolpyruvate carboxylase [Qipengyuania algicida]
MAVAPLLERLRELAQHTAQTPLYNPVFQLSHELSRELERGEIALDDIEAWVGELYDESLGARAARIRRLLAEPAPDAVPPEDFAMFRGRWENPVLHAVFTAHPTFLLSPAEYRHIAEKALGETQDGSARPESPEITLPFEHGRAMAAIANAQHARDRIVSGLCGEAREKWPEEWADFAPLPFRFATWVGYDMDGRTDIKWHTSIGFRLTEKAMRLASYVEQLEAIDEAHPLLDTLRPAAKYAQARADDFAEDLSEPAALSAAANRLTADDPAKLLSLAPLIAALEQEAGETDGGRAIALKTLAAAMRADGLGMGWVHFRVNAKQLHNALRQHLGESESFDIASKSALATLARMVEEVEPRHANFAALAIESSTAVRQFLAMAQILKHIDGDSPIRMLIAECEQPATVLAALYFSRLFGIEERVDISPLFETDEALEHGGRLLDSLLAEDVYRSYARKRGRVAIQTGFSDAGRFLGQIPASLAIERLQGRLAEAMAANGLGDVAALIFDTHGEGMGRGAHPGGFGDRLEWPLSPWARRRFSGAGIRLEPEASFQGGDGYVWFDTPEIAFRTLSRIAAEARRAPVTEKDPFYQRTDLSLDFYRAIKDHQQDYFESRTYARAVTAFGLGLLNTTGSRKSRRQSDIASDRDMHLRQIRAIPHNAILQQLGYPVNIIAGMGSATAGQFEDMAGLLAESPRGRQIVRLVRASNELASIKTVAAFGELFNSAYWASRPYRGTEDHIAGACETLADYLIGDDRAGTFRRLASRLRVDALKLHRLLALVPDETPPSDREHTRRIIGVLQALRLTLFMHMLVKAVSIPAFSRANDISRHDVLEMIFSLRTDDALKQLRRAFPTSFPVLDDFSMSEPADYPAPGRQGYATIRDEYIDPIERAYLLSLRISTAVANQFGAHG